MNYQNEYKEEVELYEIPDQLKKTVDELDGLRLNLERSGNKINDVIIYKNHLSMFLSDIKIALMNGDISQNAFYELKDRYF